MIQAICEPVRTGSAAKTPVTDLKYHLKSDPPPKIHGEHRHASES